MEGYISQEGFLSLSRLGKARPAYCPFAAGKHDPGSWGYCGDHCPLWIDRPKLYDVNTGRTHNAVEILCGHGPVMINIIADGRKETP